MALYKFDKGKINDIDYRNTNFVLTTSGLEIRLRIEGDDFPFIESKLEEFIDDTDTAFADVAAFVEYFNTYYGVLFTTDEVDAIRAATNPSATNPFVTLEDIAGGPGTEIDPVVGAIDGIVKGNGLGTVSKAVPGTDYMMPFSIYNTPAWLPEHEYAVGNTFSALEEGGSTSYNMVNTAFTSDVTYNLTGKESANSTAFYVQQASPTEEDPVFEQWLNDTPPAYPSDLHNAETATSIAVINHGATEKTVLVDGDEISGQNSGDSFSLIRITFASLKTFLSNVFVSKSSPTFSGTVTLESNTQIKLTIPSTDGHATGNITNEFNCGYTSSAIGDVVYLDVNSVWQKADKGTSVATYGGLLGIVLEVKASGAALKVALPGSFVYATGFPTLTIGSPVYLSDAGAIIVASPTTVDKAVRNLGYAIHADKIFFFPSNNYVIYQ